MGAHQSGEYDSSSWRAAVAEMEPESVSALIVALRYWPGRWPYAVVAGFLATEQYLRPMTPEEWTEMLDARAAVLKASGMLIDARPFP